MYWDKQFWHVNEMISIKDERVPSAHKKEPTNSNLYHDELFTLWARCLAHKRKSAMFTALRRRAFEGASKMAFRGMCLSILCTPSLWGLSTIVYNDITRAVRRYDSIFNDGIDHSTTACLLMGADGRMAKRVFRSRRQRHCYVRISDLKLMTSGNTTS